MDVSAVSATAQYFIICAFAGRALTQVKEQLDTRRLGARR
jgi:hypothetical protein